MEHIRNYSTPQLNIEPNVIMHGRYTALELTEAANPVARANKSRGSRRRAKDPEVVEVEAKGQLMAAKRRVTEGSIGHFEVIQFGQ